MIGNLLEAVEGWVRDILIGWITSSFERMFGSMNNQVDNATSLLLLTPETYNPDIFLMIRTISENILLPIGGLILTYVLTYELIQMITEKNNLTDFDTFNLYKWVFKTWIAVYILTNVFDIVMAIFDVGAHVVNSASGMITNDLAIGSPAMMDALEYMLENTDTGALIGIVMQSFIISFLVNIISVLIFIIVVGRMIEIYVTISLAPIPMATMVNREWSSMGNNYLKALFAVAFQGFLIMVCLAIYGVLVATIVTSDDVNMALLQLFGYTALLCFMLFKTGGISKSIFNAN